ncbi:Putative epoxidase LasC [Mycobacterium basiliense]|uniref:Epoxidase LasC n=1 Tax=Mycobacterium basiliense TaxID=2094119 RepID=A0A447GAM1_9MYCO|nr:tryptophan 7-halogenase [Mycobacterium basiliense]VDM87521.1 Putative epoxidase LasC [Mycobacterium basiliense]
MPHTVSEEFDVIVVGGGPAGSTLAALTAMQDHRVLVLEKEFFPRYQIGESLLPSTIHGVCRLSGAADELAKQNFPRKLGGTFKWGASPEPWAFSFSASSQMAGPTSYAYQVERSKFDEILLNNARRVGADVREGCAVTDLIGDDERVRGVRYTDADGNPREAHAKYVVDASGNMSRLHREVGGTRKYSEFFRSLALFGYFEGGKRLPEPNKNNILCVAFESGWFWYIPLSSTLTSVGAVVDREMAEKVQGDPETALKSLIEECPMISDFLSPAERVREGQYGKIRVRKDYSYHQTKFWRPGLVLVGDAACFVDPVFSSGVHLATYSALLAARSINSALAGLVDEDAAMKEFEARYRREYSVFYEFLLSFYETHQDESSYFWQAKKITKNAKPDLEAFIELVGGISSGESALTDAESLAKHFEAQCAEFAGAVENLSESPGTGMMPMFKSSIVRKVMQQLVQSGAEVQMQALLGDHAKPEAPLFPGGLVSSSDGMHWVTPAQRGSKSRGSIRPGSSRH